MLSRVSYPTSQVGKVIDRNPYKQPEMLLFDFDYMSYKESQ